MSRRHDIDTDRHRETRGCLRVVGPLLVVVGGVLTLIGFAGFFSAFGSKPSFDGPPEGVKLFFLCFIGLPMVAVGVAICKFAFLGSVARYVASEAAPVAKDTTNYMIDGTKDAVGDLAQSVTEGVAAGLGGEAEAKTVDCASCNAPIDAGARFCPQCGVEVPGEVRCDRCGAMNDPSAKFCDQCGRSMS